MSFDDIVPVRSVSKVEANGPLGSNRRPSKISMQGVPTPEAFILNHKIRRILRSVFKRDYTTLSLLDKQHYKEEEVLSVIRSRISMPALTSDNPGNVETLCDLFTQSIDEEDLQIARDVMESFYSSGCDPNVALFAAVLALNKRTEPGQPGLAQALEIIHMILIAEREGVAAIDLFKPVYRNKTCLEAYLENPHRQNRAENTAIARVHELIEETLRAAD